ncbi:hypothetical protein [Nocardioides acrostichi]|uniref:Uncharacterized protein n=1 Tax=Nocardioides acrostichi TaxID=2784339 RepID=A0A930V0N9_9ACTN|nr:hypothetical protein [Nocardioides acrostichi]MBF4161582.1 hypothetical protein [Nocardioides acrostichi]
MSEQPVPAGQRPGDPPVGWIDFTVQGNPMTASMVTPSVTVNGYPVPIRNYSTTPIPMPPGRHRVEVSCQWLRRYGQASLDVDVAEGQTVPVFYAQPLHQFTAGAMGFEKQKRPGRASLLALIAVITLLVVGVVLLGVL